MLRKVGIESSAEQLLLMTQYFDTMQDVARNGRSNVLYLPSNPGAVGSMGDEIRSAMLQAQAAHQANEEGDEAAAEQQRADQQRQAEQRRRIAAQQAQEAQRHAQQAAQQQNPGGQTPPPWAQPGSAG